MKMDLKKSKALNSKRHCSNPGPGKHRKKGIPGEYEVTKDLILRNNAVPEHSSLSDGDFLCRNCYKLITSLPLPIQENLEPVDHQEDCEIFDDDGASDMETEAVAMRMSYKNR